MQRVEPIARCAQSKVFKDVNAGMILRTASMNVNEYAGLDVGWWGFSRGAKNAKGEKQLRLNRVTAKNGIEKRSRRQVRSISSFESK